MISPTIRSAEQNDNPQLAGLAGQLGYPSSAAQVAVRLRSNILRQEAYQICQSIGYEIIKTQLTLLKNLQ